MFELSSQKKLIYDLVALFLSNHKVLISRGWFFFFFYWARLARALVQEQQQRVSTSPDFACLARSLEEALGRSSG